MEPILATQSTISNQGPSRPQRLQDLDMDRFLQLMITELRNQDPLNPMDNTQLIEQLGQIRQITATNQLVDSLQAVVTGQNLAAAGALIGKTVEALSDDNRLVRGKVEQVEVAIEEGKPNSRTIRLKVNDTLVRWDNLRSVGP